MRKIPASSTASVVVLVTPLLDEAAAKKRRSSILLAFFNSRSIQRSRRPRMASFKYIRTHARARARRALACAPTPKRAAAARLESPCRRQFPLSRATLVAASPPLARASPSRLQGVWRSTRSLDAVAVRFPPALVKHSYFKSGSLSMASCVVPSQSRSCERRCRAASR